MESQPSKEPILIVERVLGEMVIKNIKIVPLSLAYPDVAGLPPEKSDV